MCKYCEQKYNKRSSCDNEILLADGGWTVLLMAVNSQNKIVLRACGDDYTDDVIINYCPFCGKRINKEEK